MENRRRNIKKDIRSKLSPLVSNLKINEPLKNHTTFHIGGPAEYFIEAENIKEIQAVFSFAKKEGSPFHVLGGGSNVLVNDKGVKGIVVKLSGELKECSFDNNTAIIGCGAAAAAVMNACAEKELSGLECLAGIPGTIGGAIIGNAGSKDEWIGSVVEAVEALNESGKIEEISREKMEFGYRNSNLGKFILLKAKLNLKKSLKNDIFNKVEASIAARVKTQPVGDRSAGCVFKNPPSESAGRLIDGCGLKGLKFGGAKVSEKHANFVVNHKDAKASDVLELIKIVRQKVLEKYKVDLELEIKII